jgi:hypothetical protein
MDIDGFTDNFSEFKCHCTIMNGIDACAFHLHVY